MKILKRILLAFFVIILLAQIPFIYRRYQTGRLAETIAWLEKSRVERVDPLFKEYKGVIHAHTNLGGHSTGGFDELTAAANANGLDFVLMTEHYSDTFDTSALTLNGVFGKTLFVGGNEIDTADGDRLLMIPGSAEAAGLRKMSTADVAAKLRSEDRLAVVTAPEKFKSWESAFDGIELFSVHTNAKQMNPVTAIGDLLWTYPAYPELMLASNFKRPDADLQRFDEIAARRNISLFAGTDAHSNIGFHLFGDDAGNKLFNIKIDRYAALFGIVRLHLLIEKEKTLTQQTVVEALRSGRFFVGFDAIGDTSGFAFEADNGVQTAYQGGEIALAGGVTLRSSVPYREVLSRFVIYRDGVPAYDSKEQYVTDVQFFAAEKGVYRVEVYRDFLGPPFDRMPWIMSNPIYVR